MANTFTIQDTNRITARNILVEGDIHITSDLTLVDYPDVPEIRKEWENIAETITCTGDLYINTNEINCRNAIVYADLDDWKKGKEEVIDPIDYSELIISNPKTFEQKKNTSIKNIYFDANEIRLYGNLVSEGNIIIYSDKVFNKIRNIKINKVKNKLTNRKAHG